MILGQVSHMQREVVRGEMRIGNFAKIIYKNLEWSRRLRYVIVAYYSRQVNPDTRT